MLGLVQGLSEFLPISSSGHLILLEKVGVGEENLFFNIMLHLATLVAVLLCFRVQFFDILRHPFSKKGIFLLLSTCVTVCVAIVFKLFFEQVLLGKYLAFGFMLTAFVLILGEILAKQKNDPLTAKSSLLCGLVQGLAVLPGVSRSGSTISALRVLGFSKEESSELSFVMSIPIILGAVVFELLGFFELENGSITFLSSRFLSVDFGMVALGMIFAFVSGLVAIKTFVALVKKHSLSPFAIYDIALSVLCLVVL